MPAALNWISGNLTLVAGVLGAGVAIFALRHARGEAVRLLAWLDEHLAQLVPIAMVVGGFVAYVTFFGGHLPDNTQLTAIATGGAFCAAEWILQRRMRASYVKWAKMNRRDPGKGSAAAELGLFSGLLVLICGTATAFWYLYLGTNWHVNAALMPSAVQLWLRSAMMPGLLLISGTFAPLDVDHGALMRDKATRALRRVISSMDKREAEHISRIEEADGDLAPLGIALSNEIGEPVAAHMMRTISAGMRQAEVEAGVPHMAPRGGHGRLPFVGPDYPTGGGSPAVVDAEGDEEPEEGYTSRAVPAPRSRPLVAQARRRGPMSESEKAAAMAAARSALLADPRTPMNEIVRFGLSFQEAKALMDEVRRDGPRGRGKPRRRGKVAR